MMLMNLMIMTTAALCGTTLVMGNPMTETPVEPTQTVVETGPTSSVASPSLTTSVNGHTVNVFVNLASDPQTGMNLEKIESSPIAIPIEGKENLRQAIAEAIDNETHAEAMRSTKETQTQITNPEITRILLQNETDVSPNQEPKPTAPKEEDLKKLWGDDEEIIHDTYVPPKYFKPFGESDSEDEGSADMPPVILNKAKTKPQALHNSETDDIDEVSSVDTVVDSEDHIIPQAAQIPKPYFSNEEFRKYMETNKAAQRNMVSPEHFKHDNMEGNDLEAIENPNGSIDASAMLNYEEIKNSIKSMLSQSGKNETTVPESIDLDTIDPKNSKTNNNNQVISDEFNATVAIEPKNNETDSFSGEDLIAAMKSPITTSELSPKVRSTQAKENTQSSEDINMLADNPNVFDSNRTYSNLTYSNRTYSNLTYSNLTYSNLTDANLTDANLTDESVSDPIIAEDMSFPNDMEEFPTTTENHTDPSNSSNIDPSAMVPSHTSATPSAILAPEAMPISPEGDSEDRENGSVVASIPTKEQPSRKETASSGDAASVHKIMKGISSTLIPILSSAFYFLN